MDDIIKKRSLNLAQSLTPQQEKKLVTAFSEIVGVRRFEVKGHSGLKITYNLMQTNLLAIEKMLNEMSYNLRSGPLQRFINGWISFAEENEYEHMKNVPRTCCKDPKRL